MTEQEQQKVIEDRDSALKALDELRAELKESPVGESGLSLNWSMLDKHGCPVQLTMRGVNAASWPVLFWQRASFVELATKNGWKFPNAPSLAPAPVENKAVAIAKEEGNHQLAENIQAAASDIPEPPVGKSWNTLDIARVVIVPQPEGKVKAAFYASGHNFADLQTTWSAESVAGLLKHVTGHDVTKPADMALPCRVYYTLSDKIAPKSGRPYKDIGHVRPLAA